VGHSYTDHHKAAGPEEVVRRAADHKGVVRKAADPEEVVRRVAVHRAVDQADHTEAVDQAVRKGVAAEVVHKAADQAVRNGVAVDPGEVVRKGVDHRVAVT